MPLKPTHGSALRAQAPRNRPGGPSFDVAAPQPPPWKVPGPGCSCFGAGGLDRLPGGSPGIAAWHRVTGSSTYQVPAGLERVANSVRTSKYPPWLPDGLRYSPEVAGGRAGSGTRSDPANRGATRIEEPSRGFAMVQPDSLTRISLEERSRAESSLVPERAGPQRSRHVVAGTPGAHGERGSLPALALEPGAADAPRVGSGG